MSEEIKEIDIVEKIDRRKIKRALWITTILDDGTQKYNNKPNDPLYFQKYYDDKRKGKEGAIICCDKCLRNITAGHIIRHQKTNYCNKRYDENLIK